MGWGDGRKWQTRTLARSFRIFGSLRPSESSRPRARGRARWRVLMMMGNFIQPAHPVPVASPSENPKSEGGAGCALGTEIPRPKARDGGPPKRGGGVCIPGASPGNSPAKPGGGEGGRFLLMCSDVRPTSYVTTRQPSTCIGLGTVLGYGRRPPTGQNRSPPPQTVARHSIRGRGLSGVNPMIRPNN